VVYHRGQFLMYYSVGNEVNMQIRVATASLPAGPFVDSGRGLTTEQFAIDAHVFEDANGDRYMFYATDFLSHTHIGTGTVIDRMLDPFTLAGEPRPVTRARFDWQVYDPARVEKGGVRWHTVEGPFVLKHKKLYYQMFSGGNWKNVTYGVSYATTDDLATTAEWVQAADDDRVLPILRTLPGKVIGPGHNSVARGPDNRQLFCVYHRWAEHSAERVLAIDRQDFAGRRMIVLGPSTDSQPAPLAPKFADYFEYTAVEDLNRVWQTTGGVWALRGGELLQESTDEQAKARAPVKASSFILEVTLRAMNSAVSDRLTPNAWFGVALSNGDAEEFLLLLNPEGGRAQVRWQSEDGPVEQTLAMTEAAPQGSDQLLRLEVNHGLASLALDNSRLRWQGRLRGGSTAAQIEYGVSLVTRNMIAGFSGFALTEGWQDLFTDPGPASACGWMTQSGRWTIELDNLRQTDEASEHAVAVKGAALASYELVINARLASAADPEGCYGFYPAFGESESGPLCRLERSGGGWSLACHDSSFQLPESFDPFVDQQFRFRKTGRRVKVQWDGLELGEIEAPAARSRPALYAHRAGVAFDMVRVTTIL
ncbi:MAG TPA: glycoside hydrolase family 43 protein, partial [Blastocatellia bacterium]|nr:glycoside hydrolase family 43 protein [Blastocatellia bacterium]